VTARSKTPLVLVVAAMGIVFGDIGTSPLYTLKVCFGLAGARPDEPAVLGICSLLAWALFIVVCMKYIMFIMRVDHDGEGGILALLALASPPPQFGKMIRAAGITIIVVVGASMLLGDGIITPAISVISAVEGLSVVSPAARPSSCRSHWRSSSRCSHCSAAAPSGSGVCSGPSCCCGSS